LERSGHQSAITDLAFAGPSTDKGVLVTSALDGSVKVWNYEICSEPFQAAPLTCTITLNLSDIPQVTKLHFRPKTAGDDINNIKFLVEQPTHLELRSLTGSQYHSFFPDPGTIFGVAYDCLGSLIYVLLSTSILLICTSELSLISKINLGKQYTSIASNPKESFHLCLGDIQGNVVLVKLNPLPSRK